ncbi:WD repeat-containing protein jip5 [Pseudocercospora fuligena]|uniref:WD repeat-containing protein JIP5 n=1 Tax=Pseudocercospora fuligena TaxID=685502 RepID=A0A8H6RM86_9PEZI|nr:WD repeat-containing protein jip5 [Pseudocercospora fuligena]
MFENLCSLPLQAELFAQAVHPSEPLVSVGLTSGHVATLRIPGEEDDIPIEPTPTGLLRRGSNGGNVIDTKWTTKRHKGSCRCLAYSIDGKQLYSAGTDGIVKAADSETGKVTGKVSIPIANASSSRAEVDAPTVVHALSPQTLLLSTDSGALHLYDLRDPAPSLPVQDPKTAFLSTKPSQTYHPHTDYISSLAPIPPSTSSTSGFSKQWITTGSTTLALTDLRRGVLAKSEDQEELLLSCLYVTGLPFKKSSGSTGEKAVTGQGDGVISLWEKGQWDDQDERIIVSREKETLDCMTHIPDGIGGIGKKIAVGLGDGKVRFVRLGMNKVVGEVQHDEIEGVVALSFDVQGRMISGGGQTLKVWREAVAGEQDDDEEAEGATSKRPADDDSDVDSDEEDDVEDSSEDEEKDRKRRKKRKRGKGPSSSGPAFNFSGLD